MPAEPTQEDLQQQADDFTAILPNHGGVASIAEDGEHFRVNFADGIFVFVRREAVPLLSPGVQESSGLRSAPPEPFEPYTVTVTAATQGLGSQSAREARYRSVLSLVALTNLNTDEDFGGSVTRARGNTMRLLLARYGFEFPDEAVTPLGAAVVPIMHQARRRAAELQHRVDTFSSALDETTARVDAVTATANRKLARARDEAAKTQELVAAAVVWRNKEASDTERFAAFTKMMGVVDRLNPVTEAELENISLHVAG
jgi:hypothetical protein